jgi:hypothetical protein
MFTKFLAALTMFAFANIASAATSLTTSSAGYTGPTLNLSAYANGNYNFTFGPVSLPGGITFTAAPGGGGNSGGGSVIGQGYYGLGNNGQFGGAATYIGVDSGTGYATLTFSSLVSSFGAFWNYAPSSGDAPTISAYGASDNLLGAFDLAALAPISTPGAFNAFSYRGIFSDSADIKSIRFGGSYILLAATPDGRPVSPVPEPETYAMLLAGLGFIGFIARRKNRNSAMNFA